MRGNVYRLGRRRAGSIVLATGAALAFALGGTPAAANAQAAAPAKAPTAVARPAPVRISRGQANIQARPSVVARAAGHKIA
jgi:hypothetical protein